MGKQIRELLRQRKTGEEHIIVFVSEAQYELIMHRILSHN